jgi:hypothetical protein
MAYSFTDIYRPLRTLLRVNGLMIGCGFGAVLLFAGPATLVRWGLVTTDPGWSTRLAGALLISLGLYFLLTAGHAIIDMTALVTCLVSHGLIAIVLLLGYLQRDLAALNWGGRIVLLFVFVLCLIGALMPLRYLRAEYRTY